MKKWEFRKIKIFEKTKIFNSQKAHYKQCHDVQIFCNKMVSTEQNDLLKTDERCDKDGKKCGFCDGPTFEDEQMLWLHHGHCENAQQFLQQQDETVEMSQSSRDSSPESSQDSSQESSENSSQESSQDSSQESSQDSSEANSSINLRQSFSATAIHLDLIFEEDTESSVSIK